ncbi:diguanylate cyclase [Psychromonas sp. PT13]|uniref:sensor domain-containing diguanylate cyclase n=1 Tax=Psychromonas sp. PT13 TaxID=3439547 RepID=UPI003EBA161A
MVESYEFLKSVLDSISDHIAVIDNHGQIVFVNDGWFSFAQKNNSPVNRWQDFNYLDECDKAAEAEDDFGIKAAAGIRKIIKGEIDKFYLEYPCHSLEKKRWFMMRVSTCEVQQNTFYVISHQNITERKLAENEVFNLSRLDGLTNIPNRRYFNEFIESEWKRSRRLHLPLSLVMVDLDHFKYINDDYGHQSGDECLKQVANVLKRYAKRTSDICARYGGEEFVLVFGNMPLEQAETLVSQLLKDIADLNIENKRSPTKPVLTASAGLVTVYPNKEINISGCIKEADNALYFAKENGRNQLAIKAI